MSIRDERSQRGLLIKREIDSEIDSEIGDCRSRERRFEVLRASLSTGSTEDWFELGSLPAKKNLSRGRQGLTRMSIGLTVQEQEECRLDRHNTQEECVDWIDKSMKNLSPGRQELTRHDMSCRLD